MLPRSFLSRWLAGSIHSVDGHSQGSVSRENAPIAMRRVVEGAHSARVGLYAALLVRGSDGFPNEDLRLFDGNVLVAKLLGKFAAFPVPGGGFSNGEEGGLVSVSDMTRQLVVPLDRGERAGSVLGLASDGSVVYGSGHSDALSPRFDDDELRVDVDVSGKERERIALAEGIVRGYRVAVRVADFNVTNRVQVEVPKKGDGLRGHMEFFDKLRNEARVKGIKKL